MRASWKVLSEGGAVELGEVIVEGDEPAGIARVSFVRYEGCRDVDENEALGRIWRYLWEMGFREIEPPGRTVPT